MRNTGLSRRGTTLSSRSAGRKKPEEEARKGSPKRVIPEARKGSFRNSCNLTPDAGSAEDIKQAAKSAEWKVMIVCALKRHTSALNPWIDRELNISVPHGLSRYVGKFRATNGEAQWPIDE
jgi:hypothetical protein